jgi:chaperone required for assembly of F1-ATPase
LRVTSQISYVHQHQDSVSALRRAVAARDAYALAGLGIAVPSLGSLVLGLALADGALDADTAHRLGALEELFEAEQWGEDAEAVARREAVRADIALVARFIHLTRAPGPGG